MLAALAIATSAAGAASTPSGLRGVVMRGPTSPVCVEGEACEEPASGVLLRFSRAGAIVAQVKTGPRGRYEARLARGTYIVTTPRARVAGRLTPRVVKVPTGRVARVDFHLDTGIQ